MSTSSSNSSFYCPYPLVTFDQLHDTTLVAYGDSCAVPCPSIEIAPDQWRQIQSVIELFAYASFLASFIVFLDHLVIDNSKHLYIRKMFISGFWCASLVLSVFMYSNRNNEIVCNGPAHYIKQGPLCLFQAASTIFLFMWVEVWSAILAVDSYLQISGRMSQQARLNPKHRRRFNIKLTVFALVISSLVTAVPLFGGNLGFDSEASIPICLFLYSESSAYFWTTLFVPFYFFLLVTLVITIMSACKIHEIFISSESYFRRRVNGVSSKGSGRQRVLKAGGDDDDDDENDDDADADDPINDREQQRRLVRGDEEITDPLLLTSPEEALLDRNRYNRRVQPTLRTPPHPIANGRATLTDGSVVSTGTGAASAIVDDSILNTSRYSLTYNYVPPSAASTKSYLDESMASYFDDHEKQQQSHHRTTSQQQDEGYGVYRGYESSTLGIYNPDLSWNSVTSSVLREGPEDEEGLATPLAPAHSTNVYLSPDPRGLNNRRDLFEHSKAGVSDADANGDEGVEDGKSEGDTLDPIYLPRPKQQAYDHHSSPSLQRHPISGDSQVDHRKTESMMAMTSIWKYNSRSIIFVVAFCFSTLCVGPILMDIYYFRFQDYEDSATEFVQCLVAASLACPTQTQEAVDTCALDACGTAPTRRPKEAELLTVLIWAAGYGIIPAAVFGCQGLRAKINDWLLYLQSSAAP
jgi:hypothetical protein